MREPEFSGYWSERDKELWRSINWKERNYTDFPVEDEEPIKATGHFYSSNGEETKTIEFVKYIRSNTIFPPYYGPIMNSELREFMHENNYVGPMYDGREIDNYDVHDRFETQDLYNKLSH